MQRVGDKLVFYLSDVTGHGLDGAMTSVFVKNTINSYLSLCSEDLICPAKIVNFLANQFYKGSYPDDHFICIFIAVCDLKTKELSYLGAGFQESPLVTTAKGERLKLISPGPPISPVIPLELMNMDAGSLLMSPSTKIFLCTDGITEQASKGEVYGERLEEVFYAKSHLSPAEIISAINNDFAEFNNDSLQGDDDITCLAIQVD